MKQLWGQARMYAPLTPEQRALLKLAEGLVCAGLVAALPVLAQALSSDSVNWADASRAALAAGCTALLLALLKYCKAHLDPTLEPSDGVQA